MTVAREPVTPNFIYIGPDKAGSSWLHEVLIRHDQVFMPEAKDLYFFDRYHDRGLSWYLSQFRDAGPGHLVIGEVCQDYLFHPQAPARMKQALGQVRLMVTLRDPADRAYSSYLYMLKQGERPGSFSEALVGRPELLEHGRYATHARRFIECFGRESLYVAVFDDLEQDPQGFADALLTWLDISTARLAPDLVGARLPAGRARSAVLSRAARRASEIVRERDGANFVGRVKRSQLVQRVLYKPLADDKPIMSESERGAVHRALASEVADLDEMFGLSLAERWKWKGQTVRARDPKADAT